MTDYSDTPSGMIARLDDALSQRGQTVTITKGTTSVTVKAHVRPAKADQIVGDVDQVYLNVILSPTGLDSVLPLTKGDKCKIDGKSREIEFPKHIKSGDTLVRVELLVGG